MFMGGTTEQWIQIGIWFVSMMFLGVVTFAVSCILVNKFLHKKRKNNFKVKKIEKKSYFIDVA